MDLRPYRRICGKCIFFHCFFDRIFPSDKDEDFLRLPLNFSKIFAHAWKRLAYDLLPS